MAYLVKTDLTPPIYQEILDEITRSDDTIITKAINAGIAEAKTYLSRFDLLALFGDDVIAPTVTDEYLKTVVKDLAIWHLIRLANPNIDLKLIRTCYEDAIAFFINIQKGKNDPDGWPYKADDVNTDPFNENDTVQFSTNPKRTQHF